MTVSDVITFLRAGQTVWLANGTLEPYEAVFEGLTPTGRGMVVSYGEGSWPITWPTALVYGTREDAANMLAVELTDYEVIEDDWEEGCAEPL